MTTLRHSAADWAFLKKGKDPVEHYRRLEGDGVGGGGVGRAGAVSIDSRRG